MCISGHFELCQTPPTSSQVLERKLAFVSGQRSIRGINMVWQCQGRNGCDQCCLPAICCSYPKTLAAVNAAHNTVRLTEIPNCVSDPRITLADDVSMSLIVSSDRLPVLRAATDRVRRHSRSVSLAHSALPPPAATTRPISACQKASPPNSLRPTKAAASNSGAGVRA